MRHAWVVHSVVVLIVGAATLELYFRYAHNYKWLSLRLESQSSFWRDRDILQWNERFRHSIPAAEATQLQFFTEPPLEHTQYLLKPHLALQCIYGKCQHSDDDSKINFRTNEKTLIAESAVPVEKRRKRIFILGSSVTELNGLQLVNTLQTQLHKMDVGDYDVYNLSLGASEASSHLELLEKIIVPLKPDIVFYYWSDRGLLENEFITNPECALSYRQGNTPLCWTVHKPKWMITLYFHSMIYRLLVNRFFIGAHSMGEAQIHPQKSETFLLGVQKTVEQMAAVSRRAAAQFVVVEFQHIFELSTIETRYRRKEEILFPIYPLRPDMIKSFFKRAQEKFKASAIRQKYRYCDLNIDFVPIDFSDYAHFLPSGTEKFAKALAHCLPTDS